MALIITLWVMIILSAIALTYAQEARLDVKMTGFQTAETQAHHIAMAGLNRALDLLREDLLKDAKDLPDDESQLIQVDDDDVGFFYDAEREAWCNNPDMYKDVPMGPGTLNVKVMDESRKLNINSPTVTMEMLQRLLMTLGMEKEKEKAAAIAGAIVDWRDPDDQPSVDTEKDASQGKVADGIEFGDPETEDTYYNASQDKSDVEDKGPQYVCRNSNFENIEEMLLVKWMTPLIFYGTSPYGNGELDGTLQTATMDDSKDRDKEVVPGLKDFVTVYSNGKVNLNTVSKEVLAALLYPIRGDDAVDAAEKLVDYRNGFDRESGTDDDRVMRSLGGGDTSDNSFDKSDAVSAADLQALSSVVDVKSDYFTILSTGEVHGCRKTIRAVVHRRYQQYPELTDDQKRAQQEKERKAHRGRRRRGNDRDADKDVPPEKVTFIIREFHEE